MLRRSLILAAAVAACLARPALAADLPVKAPPLNFGPYPISGCGAYYGAATIGTAAPIINGPVGGNVAGGSINGVLGYGCGGIGSGGTNFWFAEVIGGWQNLNGGSNGFAMGGPAHIEQRVGFGGPISQILSFFPNLNLPAVPSAPALPNGITSGPISGYVYAALNEDDISTQFGLMTGRQWKFSPEVGVGALSRLSNTLVMDVWAGAKLQTGGVCFGALGNQCPGLGTGWVAGLAFKY